MHYLSGLLFVLLLWSTSPVLCKSDAAFAELQEFKTTGTVFFKPGQGRLYHMPGQIHRTSVSDARITEPVVLAQDFVYIMGQKPGHATVSIWGQS